MGNENTQTTAPETTPTDAASQNTDVTTSSSTPKSTGKGKLLPEIVMGLIGAFIAFVVQAMWSSRFCFCTSPEMCDYDDAYTACGIADRLSLFALPLFVAVPLMAECVRFGGVRSGGHGKRMRCYISAAIGPVVLLLISFLFEYGPFAATFIPLSIPVLVLAGAIIGYRKDAK